MATKTVKVPYFEGDEVPLTFICKASGKDVSLSSAMVSVFNDKAEVIHDAPCQIEDDKVSFVVPSSATQLPSNYRADFTVYFSPDITRTHIIVFHISQRLPVSPEGVSLTTVVPGLTAPIANDSMMLTEDSGDYEARGVVAQATRKLRRAGILVVEAARIAKDLAENMTGRRL